MTSCALKLCFVLAAVNANAAPITYTDEAAFHTALGDVPMHIENFETSPAGSNPMIFPTVSVTCTAPSECSGSMVTSTLLPTDGDQGVKFASPDAIQLSWAEPVMAFGLDIRDLGTTGLTDLVLIINGRYTIVVRNFSGAPGEQIFVGAIDPYGIRTVQIIASDLDGIFVDHLQTLPLDGALRNNRPSGEGIYGGERASDEVWARVLAETEAAAEAPEPVTTWLMAAGLAGILACRKLRRS
jgi:hypothetical protein